MKRITRARPLAAAAVAAVGVVGSIGAAHAGGFAIREQSAAFQGTSFAGDAAGGALASMFWNPAALAQHNVGLTSDSDYTVILPKAEIHALAGSTLLVNGADSGDIGKMALLTTSYMAYALSPTLVIGLSINTPFGLATEPDNRVWAGMTHARTSEIKTVNVTPTVGVKLSQTLSVGFGVQIEWMKGRLKQAAGVLPTSVNAVIEGEDIAIGFTAGVLWQPHATTTIGLGFRSSVDHTLDGSVFFAQPPGAFPVGVGTAGIKANLQTPETVTLSVRQGLTPQLTGLLTVEWTNWSRLDKLDVVCTTGSQIVNLLGCPGAGALQSSLPLGWHDGWFISAGLEYQMHPGLLLRGGLAYEISPVQDPDERTPRAPDSDRIWLSGGFSYKWSPTTTIDLAYTHIFVDDGKIDRTQGGIRLLADVESSVDIVSLGVRMKLGADPAPAVPLK